MSEGTAALGTAEKKRREHAICSMMQFSVNKCDRCACPGGEARSGVFSTTPANGNGSLSYPLPIDWTVLSTTLYSHYLAYRTMR